MTRIRVDPANLRQAARQLNGIADRLRALGSEAHQATFNAPSYEGQFGPKARAMGMEAEARLRAQADRFTALSEELESRAAAFEAVDQETQASFDRLTQLLRGWIEQAKPILTPYTQIALFPWQKVERHLRLGYLIEEPVDENGEGEEEENEEWSPPWWTPIVTDIAQGWERATKGAQSLANLSIYGLWRASVSADNLSKIALHRALRVPNASPGIQVAAGATTTSTVPSSGPFILGPPERPDIYHDDGFLGQFGPQSPSLKDYLNLLEWKARLEGADILRSDLSDATDSYWHFLEGGGKDRDFSYDRYVESDTSGAVTLGNAIRVAQENAEIICASTPNCSITSQAFFGGGSDARFPYPATENWQKSIGAHPFWLSADINQEFVGSENVYTMVLTLHAEDRYNFNPGMYDIETGIPDSVNGRFEITGLAHQYMHYSTLTRTVTWVEGEYDTTSIVTAPNSDSDQR